LPVYRFYNKNTGTHFYTISEAEKQSLIANYSYVWTYEGVGFYVYSNLKEYPLKNMLDSWRLLGYDKNSINENPMFVDYWNENFELKENSPALKNPINFKNINFSLVGINNKSINPISYWKFDGNANDAVGTNNGIINGAVLTSGVSGQAYRFDGVNDYISTLEKDKLDSLQKGTITAWIKCNTICPVGAIVSYASKSQASSNFLLRVNNNVLEYAWNPGGSTSWNTINSPTKINDNKWHHVAFVSDGLTRNRIYLDGIKQTTTFSKPSGRGYENDWIADINAISSSGHHISIGVLDRGSPTNWFKGDIDEIKIWDKVLTDSEIKQEYESKASTLSTYALVNKENKNLFLDWLKNLF